MSIPPQSSPSSSTPGLLHPLKLGEFTLPNRIIFGAHLTNFGIGRVFGDRHRAYYCARAEGGAGMIVTEALTVHGQDYPYEHAPCGHQQAIVPSLEALAAAVREAGADSPPLLLAQLNHTGGQCSGRMLRQSPWAPSAVADVASRKMAREITEDEIAQLVEGFTVAAGNVAAAGLDGVEINAGQHALLRQFLSPLTNFRSDGYGGCLENRARLLLEMLRAVRARIGPGKVLGLKLCGDELAPWGGLVPEQAGDIAGWVAETGLVDYLSVQIGGPYSVHRTDAGMPTPQGYGAEAAGVVRAAINGRLPVFAEGRLETAAAAQQVLDMGQGDAVVMTRALVSDPRLPKKLAGFDGWPPRPHVGMMRYFSVRGDWNRPLGDLSNPRAGREQILPAVARLQRPGPALVIGGGPAGMEAALTLAQQGREVRLVESSNHLGGMAAILAGRIASRAEFGLLVEYYGAVLEKLGVEQTLGQSITEYQSWMSDYDLIVLATGARSPAAGQIQSKATGRVRSISARDLVAGKPGAAKAKGSAVVVDGEQGFRMAAAVELLLGQGHAVDVVSEDFFVGRKLVESAELDWFKRVAEQGARLHPRLRFKKVSGRKVICEERFSGKPMGFGPVALLVHAVPEIPADELLFELKAQHPQVLRVGDAAAPRLMGEAILNAHRSILLASV